MGEWEKRIDKCDKALVLRLRGNTKAQRAAKKFLEEYSRRISSIRSLANDTKSLSKGDRTTYSKAIESALCESMKILGLSCEEQPAMQIKLNQIEKEKKLDLLVWKRNCDRSVVIEVKSSANDFDNIASGLMEFFLARSTKARIGNGNDKFAGATSHFILICLYGNRTDSHWFDICAEKLFPNAKVRPQLFSIFGHKSKSGKSPEEIASDLQGIFSSISGHFDHG